MRQLLGIVALSLSLMAPACAQPVAHAPATPAPSQLETAMLKATLGAWWGGAFVIKDGKVLLQRTYGLANESLAPFDGRTLFDLADNSKMFTAAAVLLLEQQEKLSLDDPISRFYPAAPEIVKGATIRQLLGHASGLSDKTPIVPLADYEDRDAVAKSILDTAARAPGAYLEYCNRGYNLVACIVEQAAGVPFDTFMREQVFAPAGMAHSGFLGGSGLDASHAALRVASGRLGAPGRENMLLGEEGWDWRGRGATGMVSCIDDMLAWERSLREGKVLTPAHRDKLFQNVIENYGLGWYIQTTPRNTTRAWHGGSSKGFVSLYFRLLEEDTSLFVVTNENGDADRIITTLERELYPALPLDFSGRIDFFTLRTSSATTFNEPAQWLVAREKDGQISLRLKVDSFPVPIAHLVVSEGLARQMMAVLKDSLRTMPEGAAKSTTATVNPGKLPFNEHHQVLFSDEARVELRAAYRTRAQDGSMSVDYRPMVVVIDPKGQNWPLMVQMERGMAQNLYDQVWSLLSAR
jgi:CubicO group peptidase (beta-lactamase class C family)